MITDVEVEDFQAIRKASIKLGKLTVVTGPTGSGKSGLLRAIELVAFNARGTRFIRHGTDLCQAALGFRDENIVVVITRGGRGKDSYQLVWHEGSSHDNRNGVQFTKLAGSVPPEVSEILQLSEINFAGQWDKPYLLTEAGGQVARVLGELTNVTLVLDAARSANRAKLEAGAELKRAEARLADLTEQAKGFRGLKARIAAAQDAQEHLIGVDFIQENLLRLQQLVAAHNNHLMVRLAAEHRLERATPPTADRLTELEERWQRLVSLSFEHAGSKVALDAANEAARNCHWDHVKAEEELHQALVNAGTCPTCGQAVSALWRDFQVSVT